MKGVNQKKNLKKFFRSFDYFGVQFSFDYKNGQKYKSATGGIIFILFLISLIVFMAVNAGGFIRRENMSIIYYTLKLSKTDEISFKNYSSTLAFSLTCGHETQETMDKYFVIETNFTKAVYDNGVRNKEKRNLKYHPCTHSDFYNEFNNNFDSLGLNSYNCLELEDTQIEGVYSDLVFGYYEIQIRAKEGNSDVENEEMMKIMRNSECQFNYYYIEDMINIHNYKSPIERFINTNFFVLKSNQFTKVNLYFKTQQFKWDNNWIFEKTSSNYYLSYDFFEEYASSKGEDRFIVKPAYYNSLAALYIRASLSRNIIERRYMKLTEFVADQTSLFSKILLVVAFAVMYLDYFFAYQSMIKKFFVLKSPEKKAKYQEVYKDIKNFLKKDVAQEIKRSEIYRSTVEEKLVVQFLDEADRNNEKRSQSGNKDKKNSKKKNNKNNVETKRIGSDIIFEIPKKEDIPKENKKPKYSNKRFHKIIAGYLCPCVRLSKKELEHPAHKIIESNFFLRMDVRSYMKMCQMVDMLNFLLLSEKRTPIINFLSNPSLSFGNIQITKDIERDLNNYFRVDRLKLRAFLNRVTDLASKENRSPLDDKVLCLIIREFDNIVEQNNLFS